MGEKELKCKAFNTLEVNPNDELIEELRKRVEIDENDLDVKDLIMVLYDVSLLGCGFNLEDTKSFATRTHKFLKEGLLSMINNDWYFAKP